MIYGKCSKTFFQNSIVNKNVNETYIALIAKKEKCIKATDYKPISLTTSLYKIIAKTLAERLKQTLPSSISENQLTFVKNKQITDVILWQMRPRFLENQKDKRLRYKA